MSRWLCSGWCNTRHSLLASCEVFTGANAKWYLSLRRGEVAVVSGFSLGFLQVQRLASNLCCCLKTVKSWEIICCFRSFLTRCCLLLPAKTVWNLQNPWQFIYTYSDLGSLSGIGTHFSHLNEFEKIIFSYTLETTTPGAFDLLYYFCAHHPFHPQPS